MKALFNHIYPAIKVRIENRMDKLDFGDLKFVMKEFSKCLLQFWNFGKLGEIILPLEETVQLVELLAKVAKVVKEDREIRLE